MLTLLRVTTALLSLLPKVWTPTSTEVMEPPVISMTAPLPVPFAKIPRLLLVSSTSFRTILPVPSAPMAAVLTLLTSSLPPSMVRVFPSSTFRPASAVVSGAMVRVSPFRLMVVSASTVCSEVRVTEEVSTFSLPTVIPEEVTSEGLVDSK